MADTVVQWCQCLIVAFWFCTDQKFEKMKNEICTFLQPLKTLEKYILYNKIEELQQLYTKIHHLSSAREVYCNKWI